MTMWRVLTSAAATIGVVLLAPTALPAQPDRAAEPAWARQDASCVQPYEPWYSVIDAYNVPADAPPAGTSVLVDTTKPDTDGDGTPDTIVDAGSGGTYASMTIARGDGVITLTPGSHDYVYENAYSPPPGDLDGDGHDELTIGVDQQNEQYLLPGITAPGTHAIDDVGILVDETLRNGRPVGDQNGDGADDMAFGGVGGTISIISGSDLLAPGAGGTLGALSTLTPIATYPGTSVAAAFLTPGQPATIITGSQGTGGFGAALTVNSDPPVELTAHADPTGTIGAYTKDGATFITLASSNRSGTSIAIWNLTDPCSRYAVTAPVPTDPTDGTEATPAAPVDGSPDYTG